MLTCGNQCNLRDVSGCLGIDQLIARINTLIAENDERQKKMETLELNLCQVQEELEYYYVLSREQTKIIELNEKLNERTITLLGSSYYDSFHDALPEER